MKTEVLSSWVHSLAHQAQGFHTGLHPPIEQGAPEEEASSEKASFPSLHPPL